MKSTAERDDGDSKQIAPKPRTNSKRSDLEDVLDEALEGTFPASDAVSLIQPVKKRGKKSGPAADQSAKSRAP